MGERVYSRVTCRKKDAKHFKAIGYDFEYDEAPAPGVVAVTMVDTQANYGNHNELLGLQGLPFIVENGGACGVFGPSLYVSDGRTTVHALRVDDEATGPAIQVSNHARITGTEDAIAYLSIELNARKKLRLDVDPKKTRKIISALRQIDWIALRLAADIAGVV
jgi:hypothetical protein